MGSKLNKTVRTLAKSMKGASSTKTTAYDTKAKVVRVQGDTVWVHIPGGVSETPIKQTIAAKKGDTVQIRIANGTGWIVGNYTEPPSGASSTVNEILTGGEIVIPPTIENITNQYCFASISSLSELDEDEEFEDYMETEWLDHIPTINDMDYDPEDEEEYEDEDDEDEESDLFIWYRQVTTMTDGTVIYGDPMLYPNAKDGISMVSMRLQYCVCDESRIPDGYDFDDIRLTKWFSRIPTQEDLQDPEEDEDYEPEEDGFYSDDEDFASDIADVKEDGWNLDGLTNVIEFTVDGNPYSDYTVTGSGTEDATVHVNASTFNPTDSVEITYDYVYTFDYDDEEEEYYIWMRAVMLMSDGSTKYGTPAYLPGVNPGDTEINIKVIIAEEPEYCLASATVVPDGDDFEDIQETPWTTTVPTYQEGNYYWRRVKYYYSDGSVAYSPPFYDFAAQIAHEVAQAESSQDNHFWHDTSGAYIGHVEGDKNSGSVLRAVSGGILLTYNGDTMASFTQSGFGLYGTVGNQRVNLVSYSNGGISFNDNVDFYIGNNSSYIKWDSVQDKIVIVADTLLFGANATDLETELASMQDDIDDAASDASTAKTTANSASTNASSAYNQAVAAQSAASDAATKATNFLKSTNAGLQIIDTKNTSNYALISSSGMDVYYGSSSVASFGASARVGYASGSNLYFESNKINFRSGSTTYGDIRYYYSSGGYQFLINSDSYGIFIDAGTNLTLNTPSSGSTKVCINDTVVMNTNYVSSASGNARYRVLFPCASANPVTNYNLGMNSNGAIGAYSSSRRFKEDISYEIEPEFNPEKLYDIPVVTFRYKEEYRDIGGYDADRKFIGFIAEDVNDIYYSGAIHDKDGTVHDWNFRTLLPAMLKLIQDQHAEIETIKAQLN